MEKKEDLIALLPDGVGVDDLIPRTLDDGTPCWDVPFWHYRFIGEGTEEDFRSLPESFPSSDALIAEIMEDSRGVYDLSRGSVRVDVMYWAQTFRLGDDEKWVEITTREGSDGVTVHPAEPDCACGSDAHDWQNPLFLGGLESNPGARGHSGGVSSRHVCARCGVYVTHTHSYNDNPGEPRDSVCYDDPDERSQLFVSSCRAPTAHFFCIPTHGVYIIATDEDEARVFLREYLEAKYDDSPRDILDQKEEEYAWRHEADRAATDHEAEEYYARGLVWHDGNHYDRG